MEDNKKNLIKDIIIWVLLLTGFALTIYLAHVYYEANFNRYAMPSFCALSEFMDCDAVARTTESQFFGVPLAYWGMFLYSFIMMLMGVDRLKKFPGLKFLEVFKNKYHYIASLGIISFAISMVLLCVSLFVINKLCIMCAATYVINLIMAIVAMLRVKTGVVGVIKQSWFDFIDALKPIPYRVAFIVVMVCAVGFLGWAYTSAKFSPALKYQRNYGEFVKTKVNKYAVKGNLLGSEAEDAVVLHVYSDYMCPMCSVFNMMVHKLAGDFTNVRVQHHSLPLDTECNKYMTQEFHFGSCTMARYAEAAHMQGKFWEVNSLFFEKKPSTEEEVIGVLERSGFGLDMDKLKKDASSKEVIDIINADIDYAVGKEQIGTPTMHINEEFEMGIPKGGYPALKQWVRERGGKEKHILF
ncbi:DsbA family protein [bacterium]|nr:DsbA family protein [bacterium]